MTCTSCGEKPKKCKCHNRDFPSAVVEINNPEQLVLLRKVVIPSSLGDDTTVPPAVGKYRNVILQYEANNHIYLYSSDGIPTAIESNVPQEVLDRITDLETETGLLETSLAVETDARERADQGLQQEIDDLKNSPDVVDIVATYADLMEYDTSSLGDKDVIRVLRDETHDGQSAYYRWDKPHSTWIFIGTVGDYYTKQQVDALLDDKQDELTPGENITIEDESGSLVISATDTTYSAGSGLNLADTIFSVDTTTIATQADLDAKQDILTAGDNITIEDESGALVISATDTKYTAGNNVQISPQNVISATDTTYTHFTGATASTDGTQGLVPGPLAGDEDKYLKADGTWGTVQAGPTVVQTTGTSTTDVMSQNATTSMVFADPATQYKIKIGAGTAVSEGDDGIEIGHNAKATAPNTTALGTGASATDARSTAIGQASRAQSAASLAVGGAGVRTGSNNSIAIGYAAEVGYNKPGAIALGAYSSPSATGEMNIGSSSTSYGYNSSNYRLLTGLYDGQSAHDAVTVGQVISYSAINGAGAPTTATEGKYVGQLYYDTTNESMYFLKTIDTTTTPATYTWEALGGGSITPVQTTGTSTTDVMSQNAVTSMVFADPSSTRQVQIGNGALARGTSGIAIGAEALTYDNKNYAIAIGKETKAGGTRAVGIGKNSSAAGDDSIAVGANSVSSGIGSVSIGSAAGGSSGSGAVAQGDRSIAIGYGAKVTNTSGTKGQIALGAYSEITNITGVMNIGSTNTDYGYNSSNYRLLTGLYAPQSAHDAATKGYVDDTNSYSSTETATGGTWVDGSPIYKKTISLGALPNATTNSVSHGITNLGYVIKTEGAALSTSGVRIDLPFASSSGTSNVQISIEASDVKIDCATDRSDYTTAYVTLYYTKSA